MAMAISDGSQEVHCERIDVGTENVSSLLLLQEGQHPLTGQRAANFRLLANQ